MNFAFVGDKNYLENYLPNLLRSINLYSVSPVFHIICNEDFNIPGFKYEKYIEKNPIVKNYTRYDGAPHITDAVFLKMSLFDLLPIDKYMYMDVDCILTGSLDHIDILLNDYSLVTTKTIWGYKLINGEWIERNTCSERWNTGFFGFDLSKFVGVKEKFVKRINEVDMTQQNGETSIFNDVITPANTNIYFLTQNWNWCTGYLDDIWNVVPTQAYRYIEMGQLINLKSIHYSGKNKPWNSECLYHEYWKKFNKDIRRDTFDWML